MKKQGISLIVLVITIIIIIILAGAVILNLADNNPIENASEAKIASDLDAFKSDLTIQIGQKYLKNTMLKIEDIDSNETKDDWKLTDLVPSIKGTNYEEHLIVVDGSLKLKYDSDLDDSTKAIIEEKIGSNLVTAKVIEANPANYYGQSINFEDGKGLNNWKIFYSDGNKIYLIAGAYVDKSMTGDIGLEQGATTSCFKYSGASTELMNIISNKDNFSGFKDANGKAEYVVGGPTLEQFVNSYNSVSHSGGNAQKIYLKESASAAGCYAAKDTNNITDADVEEQSKLGLVENESLKLPVSLDDKGDFYYITSNKPAAGHRLLGYAANGNVYGVARDGSLAGFFPEETALGLRPVVCLNSNVGIVMNSNNMYDIVE